METKTAFDLNNAVEQWRTNLGQSPAYRQENLNELEAHLHDSIRVLQAGGLSAEESFLIATRRIGQGGRLEKEFAKVNRNALVLNRAMWMLIGIQVWGLVAGLTGSVSQNALAWGWSGLDYDSNRSGVALPYAVFGLGAALSIGLSFVICWWLLVRNGERLDARLMPLLTRRSKLIAASLGILLLSAVINISSGLLMRLLINHIGGDQFGQTAMYLGFASAVGMPTKVITMLVLTVMLARKQMRLQQAEN